MLFRLQNSALKRAKRARWSAKRVYVRVFHHPKGGNSSKRDQCLSDTVDAISMIELILSDHPNHDVIIGGDFNTELKGDSPFDPFWSDLVTKNSFAYCDNLVQSIRYTYRHDTLNQTKFNDHFLVSQSLLTNGLIDNHRILDEGSNPSDHLPLLLSLKLQLPELRPFTRGWGR